MTIIKSAEEIAIMREAGRIVAITLRKMSEAVKPGMKTRQLDELAEKEVSKFEFSPAFIQGLSRFSSQRLCFGQ